MDEDWWPDMLRGLAGEDLWADEMVTVAELAGYDDAPYRGQRKLWSALVSPETLGTLDGTLRSFNHEVESTGRPGASAAGKLKPRLHISAYFKERRIECEPFILGWEHGNRTAMVLDPGFAMTYGLMPRALGDGTIHWDDPAAPEPSVAIIDPPSIYADLKVTGARARVRRTHLQDYLTLRGLHLIQVFYETRSSSHDGSIALALDGREGREIEFADRTFDLSTNHHGGHTAQVWGARVIAGPGDLPITAFVLDARGLTWPGFPDPVTHGIARKARMHDWVYVRDTVLGAYEGQPGFSISPESGGVSFGGQWSVGHCERVGRDAIRVELKKLYEGVPDRVIFHWHAHALAPSPALQGSQGRTVRNIAMRAKQLVLVLLAVGERLAELILALGLPERSSEDLVGLDRAFLEYNGWWNGPFVEPVTRHAPLGMSRDGFLDRMLDLDKLTIESLAEKHLRPLVKRIGAPEERIDGWRGLKLLDRIVCLAQVANAGGLSLATSGDEVVGRLARDGTDPAQPLNHLFAISDLRQVKGHRKDVDAVVEGALERFGLDARAAVGGWGSFVDGVYDGAIADLVATKRTLVEALTVIQAG